ncbi:hypothetical protein Patl1_23039 [Pistacia atlantica]|uniref:Uncharacterized protein n=1 Tax=Pistacia atlantica TaxID=434234 RepID=A0ACC0ZY67_9ROSI|nr:hypothetical protein Patl1_23039 [Pistacia atlantica]
MTYKAKRCYKCQGIKHFAASYPNRQVVTIIEEEKDESIYDEEASKELENGEIIYGDQGECLVVKMTLNVEVVEEGDSWLCNNIFHVRCTTYGKLCNIIIDGGSCKNVITSAMIDKLSLQTQEHPRLYKLSWFKKGNEGGVLLLSATAHSHSKKQQRQHANVHCRWTDYAGQRATADVLATCSSM